MSIIAIRIYLDLIGTPIADLKTADGVCETIQWNDKRQRKQFEQYINGCTLIYDERPKSLGTNCN